MNHCLESCVRIYGINGLFGNDSSVKYLSFLNEFNIIWEHIFKFMNIIFMKFDYILY